MRAIAISSATMDTHANLALEECLFESVQSDQIVMLLWQSKNAVVIGRNQNAWRECNIAKMKEDGVTLARRFTGGGAVYQDAGNMNFCFVAANAIYDTARQQRTVLAALAALGIDAKLSGRNDITVEGRKVSGQAFRNGASASLHHGTMLICADLNNMGRYLNVAPQKLQSKGVLSVRARVENLCAFNPRIDREGLSAALLEAFSREYGAPRQFAAVESIVPAGRLGQRRAQLSAYDWNYGQAPAFDYGAQNRFDFGLIEIGLIVRAGSIQRARVYSDTLDTQLPARVADAIEGARFLPDHLAAGVREISGAPGDAYAQIADWLEELDL